ncbi:MAG: Stp1/IreP family PP2C-type Ser/Thr phosphatase [Anaerolineae bacterium]|nr:Stp1/IreP family PP2C-type Ser/Thr phosphatase [Anaerolineae bacterium]MCA9907991.1 Stp1/IreP family PP2C-type Ser/Thr phosphatase [Anaerolineae bacterium]
MQIPGRKRGLRSGARTSVGQVRENNEDSIHLDSSDDYVLAIVADGMGGAVAGEEASRLAVEAIREKLADWPGGENDAKLKTEQIAGQLRAAIRWGNDSIVQRATDSPELRGMGTTVTLAYVRYSQAVIAHVGDSRAYLVSMNSLPRVRQITDDHSFVEALVNSGYLTPEEAAEHPMRNVLYRALGQTEELDVDIYHTRLRPGDRLILCSDGLTRHVKPAEIAEKVLTETDPQSASDALIELANSRGGEDNISAIVVMVDGEYLMDETPMLVKAFNPLLLLEDADDKDDGDTLPIKDTNENEESDPTLQKVDSEQSPSPERLDEANTLPNRDQLDKRARLLQLQWLVDEVLLTPDPLDNAITDRAHLVGDHSTAARRDKSDDEDGSDANIPKQ